MFKKTLAELIVLLICVSTYANAAFALNLQDMKGVELLSQMRVALAEFAAVELDFEVVVEDGSGVKIGEVEGIVRAQGRSYKMVNNEMELFCDGISKWILMRGGGELVIMPNDTTASDIVENPVGFLSSLGLGNKDYNVSDKVKRVGGELVVELSAAKKKGVPYKSMSVHVNGESKLPSLVEIVARDGSKYLIRITSVKSVPKLDNSQFAFPESRLKDLTVTDLRS